MRTILVPFIAAVMALAMSRTTSAQSFAIDWFTIDGGGGSSAGGVYSVVGTMGQPDAGLMTGEGFSVSGGFWFRESSSPPRLSIVRFDSNATISWAPVGPGFILQVSDDLGSEVWTDAPSGNTNPITVSTDGRSRFYRLSRR